MLAVSVIIYAVWLAVSVLAPVYFQVALGAKVSEAGLLMIPIMLSSTLTANLAGRYTRRHGRYKRPPLFGLPLTVALPRSSSPSSPRISPPMAPRPY